MGVEEHERDHPVTDLETRIKKQKRGDDLVYNLSNGAVLTYIRSKSTVYYSHYSFQLRTLDDLISLDEFYTSRFDKTRTSNIQFFIIHRIAPVIKQLLSLIGMEDVKRSILYIVSFYMQQLQEDNNDMLHTVIYGSPGCGKTRLCQILADVYAGLGILPTNRVTFVKRADLVAGYLGQTAQKTKKAIEDALGGVLVIDEAYSLGDREQRDSFSRECIDTLNQYLSERKGEFVCVIAGYKADLDERFFKTNPGLSRRFPVRFHLPKYTPDQLRKIFMSMVKDQGWKMNEGAASIGFFKDNEGAFEFQGGDMELLFSKVKYEHGLRVFGQSPDERKVISKEDIDAGMEQFALMRQKKEDDRSTELINMMYT